MLLGELKANLDLDLVSELYIDKFNEKITKLEDNQISNVKLKAKKEDDYIIIETSFYEGRFYTYNISISEDFKIKIETFTTTKTDFESILHNINIVKSISSEILEEIKNEILYNDDIYRLKYYDLYHRVLHMNNKKKNTLL